MADRLDRFAWRPPPRPLSVSEIQRGIAPITYVRNERATEPFDKELEHWSALPALSYFALNAVTLRESSRRIPPPSTFRPPPRLTLSDQRRQMWLKELKNPRVPLRALSRAVPHGYTSGKLLDMLIENDIPVSRAVWFIKCIGANEVRALKRKHGIQASTDLMKHRQMEAVWLHEWTGMVCATVMRVIDSFDSLCQSSSHYGPTESSNRRGSNPASNNNGSSSGSASGSMPPNKTKSTMDTNCDSKPKHTQNPNDNNDTESSAGADSLDDLFQDNLDGESLSTEVWQKHMEYVSQLSLSLYSGSLLDRRAFLEWILNNLRDCAIRQLPCFMHLVYLFWEPLAKTSLGTMLLRVAVHRYNSIGEQYQEQQQEQSNANVRNHRNSGADGGIIIMYFDPLVFKLLTYNDELFVSPRLWPTVEPHLRGHPAYARVAERNQAFMLRDPKDPSDWTHQLIVGSLLDNFARPYKLDELMMNISSLGMEPEVLVRTILLRTLRQETTASVALCIAVLKRLVRRPNIIAPELMSRYCVDFLLDPHLIHSSRILGALVSELVRAKLCHLDLYVRKLISYDVLNETPHTSQDVESAQSNENHDVNICELHIRLLHDLPFDWLPPNLCTQVRILLLKAGRAEQPVDLNPLVANCTLLLAGKPVGDLESDIVKLHTNDRHRLGEKLIKLFEDMMGRPDSLTLSPSVLCQFAKIMDTLGTGSFRPLFRVLVSAISSTAADPALVKCALRQVHTRLMAFVCSGLIDALVRRLLMKLDSIKCTSPIAGNNGGSNTGSTRTNRQAVLQWLNWDDISALRSVIQSPTVMFELNSVIPLRQVGSLSASLAHTPVERDALIHAALYNSGSPDVGALLALRGDEALAHDIALWAHDADADGTAILQLLAYHAVTINELVDTSDKKCEMLRFLLLAPSSERGFCCEEIESLRQVRYKYLSELPLRRVLELMSSVAPIDCASRIAHAYPEFYMNRVIIPAMQDPESLELLRRATVVELRRFEVLLLRSTPFNLRYYQGLVMLAFHNKNPDHIAQEVLTAAYAHTEASSALQLLLQNLDERVKRVIFAKTVHRFLSTGLDEDQLSLLDVNYTLIGALSSSVVGPVTWSLERVPSFLEKLNRLAGTPGASRHALHRSLALVMRICVIGGLYSVYLPENSSIPLRKLLHRQVFADSYKVRMAIEDTLRLIKRTVNDQYSGDVSEKLLRNGPSAIDGLRVYSKRADKYEPLPIWAFDLIEDASPAISKNDGAVDLALFETYED